MEPLYQRLTILVLIGVLTGLCTGDDVSVHYYASGVIVNHNFTKEFYTKDMKDCEPCQNLANDVRTGLWKMFDFFVQVNLFKRQHTVLLNKTDEGIFFRPPSLGGQDINATEKTEIPPDQQKEEKGVYFIMVMRLDLNVTDPSRNLHDLKKVLGNTVWGYLRTVVHFQIPKPKPKVLLNETAFVFKEIPESGVTDYLKLLKRKHGFTSKTILRKHEDIPENHQNALTVISYVGCAFSAVGLTLTILTIVLSRKLRRLRQNQLLVYLCISLLAAILLFTFGINGITDSDSLDLCKAMAAFLHYFLLSSIVWMSIEAYNLYQDLVKVFDTTLISQNEFMCRAGVVGWIIPAVIVVITVLAEPDSYGFHVTDKNNETLCWMDADAFYGAFLAPVLLLMVVNVFIFIAVMKEIYNIPHMSEKTNRLSHFRATVSVFFLLGLNWLFAGLASTVGTLVFHYLFTITCSFQGLLIFVLHGIIKKDFQEAWRMLTTKNRVMEMIRTTSLGTKAMSISSQNSSLGIQGRDNPISLSGSAGGDSGIEIQVGSNLSTY
ncbi:uncharacterized protein LOC144657585 [Oculina patagonica]